MLPCFKRLFQQLLRDLHRVQRRVFEQLIAGNPEASAVIQHAIFADAAHLAMHRFTGAAIAAMIHAKWSFDIGNGLTKATPMNTSEKYFPLNHFSLFSPN